MLKILLFCLLSTLLLADIKRETGSGSTKEAAIENAKEKIFRELHQNILITVYECIPFATSMIGYDEKNYKATLLTASSIFLFEDGVNLKADFDVEMVNTDIKKDLDKACLNEVQVNNRNRVIGEFFSQFNLGVGLSVWSPSYGAEIFATYRHDGRDIYSDYSIYLTASYGTYVQSAEEGGSVSLVGAQVRIVHFLLLGYEKVLNVNVVKNTVVKPTAAFTIGAIFSLENTSYEWGLLFKNLNSKDIDEEGGTFGGAFVRYKIF